MPKHVPTQPPRSDVDTGEQQTQTLDAGVTRKLESSKDTRRGFIDVGKLKDELERQKRSDVPLTSAAKEAVEIWLAIFGRPGQDEKTIDMTGDLLRQIAKAQNCHVGDVIRTGVEIIVALTFQPPDKAAIKAIKQAVKAAKLQTEHPFSANIVG